MTRLRIVAVATALYACFMWALAPAAQGPVRTRLQSTIRYGSAYFKIKVPSAPKPPAARGIRPLYLSPSTKSFAISIDGMIPVVANVNPSTYYAIVTLRHISVGIHNFKITAYDRLGGMGTVLSVGNTGPVTIPPGYVTLGLTLSGVVASLALVLDYPNPTLGSPAVINLNVIAKDPDGNLILPASGGTAQPYTRAFTLTTSDAANGKLSTTTVQQSTGSINGFRVSVAYSGANVSKIVFSATGGGLGPQAVTPATLVPLAPPKSGQQLIAQQQIDPVSAFSTLDTHQLLGSIGLTLPQTNYASVAADDASRLIYIENGHYPSDSIDIFASSGSYGMVGSISTPAVDFGGLAVDSAGGKVFSAQYGFDPDFSAIMVYSTSPGHALIGKIPYTGVGSPSLAVDSVARHLYAAGCAAVFGCSPGFKVFGTAAPYKLLGSFGQTTFGTTYCSVAVDSVSERLFLSECNLPNENPSYVDVYEPTDFNHRAARIGPLMPGAQLAIDAKGRTLYVTSRPESLNGFGNSVDLYGLDNGFLPEGSFPIHSVEFITVAPYAH